MATKNTIFAARKIITLNDNQPLATHVAVRDGRILAVGDLDQLSAWGPYQLDDTFADKIIIPGLVEGHSHAMEGGIWNYTYVGYHDRRDPDGKLWPGLASIEAVVKRLQQADADITDPQQPLVAWGFDPIYFAGRRMTVADLDHVSKARPIVVIHASFHLLNTNRIVLQKAGINADTPVAGILKDAQGQPTGELQEMAAKFIALRAAGADIYTTMGSTNGVRRFGQAAQAVGVTTAADLYNELSDAAVEIFDLTTADERFPLRIVPAFNASSLPPAQGVEKMRRLQNFSTDKLHFGIVKLMTDGSIQGFTARLKWPGYYNGAVNGIWNLAPEQLQDVVSTYHNAGLQLHIHTNGDEASEIALDAVAAALARSPRWDHRHTLQHCQMADASQFRRMATLGMCVNLFSNHIYYWGDAHYTLTMGPDRAQRMDATATAKRSGVPFAIHSDAPVTPIGPLFTAWCAVNRQTHSGKTLGEAEQISVSDALRAITLGAAYTLKLDHKIGSIEVGKWADFTILGADPLTESPMALKDIPIWGTVLDGQIFAGPNAD